MRLTKRLVVFDGYPISPFFNSVVDVVAQDGLGGPHDVDVEPTQGESTKPR